MAPSSSYSLSSFAQSSSPPLSRALFYPGVPLYCASLRAGVSQILDKSHPHDERLSRAGGDTALLHHQNPIIGKLSVNGSKYNYK